MQLSCDIFDCSIAGLLIRLKTRLTCLSLLNGWYADDNLIQSASMSMTSLRKLNIRYCGDCSDVSLLHVAQHLGDTLEVLCADLLCPQCDETKHFERIWSALHRTAVLGTLLRELCAVHEWWNQRAGVGLPRAANIGRG